MIKQLSSRGPCCACNQSRPNVRNWIFLPVRGLVAGRGWGCLACGLPKDGAIAVVCDPCFIGGVEVRFACAGFPREPARVPVSELMGEFEHDITKHPELGFGREEATG